MIVSLETPQAPTHDPYDAPPDMLFEVVNGQRVEKNMSVVEALLAGRIFRILDEYCENHHLGIAVVETFFAIPGSENDRRPDVAFVSLNTWPANRGFPRVNAWPIAPDLAIEVVSPSDKAFDVIAKVHEYFAGGVKAVWLVWSHLEVIYAYSSPAELKIYTRPEELPGEPLLPGFRLKLDSIFPMIEPQSPAS